jgi:hypothetical protein
MPERVPITLAYREVEAKSVAFMVCKRNGVSSKSESHWANPVPQDTTIDRLDPHLVTSAAGQVETLLGLTAHTKYDEPGANGGMK